MHFVLLTACSVVKWVFLKNVFEQCECCDGILSKHRVQLNALNGNDALDAVLLCVGTHVCLFYLILTGAAIPYLLAEKR